ncbi:hypothetical protein Gotur_024321 [Gossypium turneri]
MPLIQKQLIGFISRVEFVIPTLGLHMAVNECAAAAVATSMGVPVSMRSEFVVVKSGIKIVNDAFNANPISTKAGIDTLKNIHCDGKRVAILGDMFELGTHEIRLPLLGRGFIPKIFNCLNMNDVVLVKGGRQMQMVKVVDAIKAMPRFTQPSCSGSEN